MRSSRSSLFGLLTTVLTVGVLSLSLERAALADDAETAPPGEITPTTEPPPLPSAEPTPAPPLPTSSPALAPALAPAPAPSIANRDVAEASDPTAALQPWDVDIRAGLHTTPILEYGGVGASADAGVRKLGPGTLAVGGGVDYFLCGTSCSSAPYSLSQRQLSFEGRVSYHLSVPKVARMDIYPLITAGFMVSRSSINVGGNSEYRASDVAPSVGFGAGASYFFTDRIFVGAEARFRYAAGSYSYELASGQARSFDRSGVSAWNASTVDLALAVGTRF
jgi:opacity protein-like surface antigen